MSGMTYEGLLGPVLGKVMDVHQWDCEMKTQPKFETAVGVHKEGDKVLQMYPEPTAMVLKLVEDGVCTRQMRAKNHQTQKSIDIDSISKIMTRFGFQTCNGTKALMKYLKTLQETPVDGPTIIMASPDTGKVCKFQILGGMWRPTKSEIRVWCSDFDETLDLESSRARELTAPFSLYIGIE